MIGTGSDGRLQSQDMGIGGRRGSDYGSGIAGSLSVKGSDADGPQADNGCHGLRTSCLCRIFGTGVG